MHENFDFELSPHEENNARFVLAVRDGDGDVFTYTGPLEQLNIKSDIRQVQPEDAEWAEWEDTGRRKITIFTDDLKVETHE